MEERAPDTPTELPKQAWGKVLAGSLREFKKDELTDRAAALTYYGVLALFPALLALVSLLGITGKSTTNKVLDNLKELAPGPARDILTRAVQQLQGSTGIGSLVAIVGLVVAIWSASGYVAAFMRAANAVYDMPEGRPAWKILPVRVGVTVVLMVLAVASALIVVFTGGLARQGFRHRAWCRGQRGDGVVDRQMARPGRPGHHHDRDPVLGVPEREGQGLQVDHAGQFPRPGHLAARLRRLRLLRRELRLIQQDLRHHGGVVVFLVWLWISNLAILLGLEFDAEAVRQRAVAGGHPPQAEPYVQPRDTRKWDDDDLRRMDKSSE